MYKVIVTADGTAAAASKRCRTKQGAESIKAKLTQMLKQPVDIEIMSIGRRQ